MEIRHQKQVDVLHEAGKNILCHYCHDMGINFGGFFIIIPQKFQNYRKINSVFKKVDGKKVAECMRGLNASVHVFQMRKNPFDLALRQDNRWSTMPLRLDVVNAVPDVNIQDAMAFDACR